MAKMTPEEEARYALDFGVSRRDLPQDARLATVYFMRRRPRGDYPHVPHSERFELDGPLRVIAVSGRFGRLWAGPAIWVSRCS
jgi:hypothetical protein